MALSIGAILSTQLYHPTPRRIQGVENTLGVRLGSGLIGFVTVVKLIPLTLDRSLQCYAPFP
jgi:hypothetical protein